MLVPAPPRLDEAGVETLLAAIARRGDAVPEGIDCSGLHFADPCGVLALLTIGLSGAYRRGRAWGVRLPREPAVLSWLERCGARELLARLFVVEGPPRASGPEETGSGRHPVLLEIAVVREPADVHRAVARIKARADLLLVTRLGYSPLAADRFSVALAEICQNIVDHSGSPGLAAAQCYLGGAGREPEIRIAVADAGIGVRESLLPRYGERTAGAFDDGVALRLALQDGVTRFDDPGRGLGLAAVAQLARAWGGSLRLRSGRAAVSVGAALPGGARSGAVAWLPGTQVAVRLPHAEVDERPLRLPG